MSVSVDGGGEAVSFQVLLDGWYEYHHWVADLVAVAGTLGVLCDEDGSICGYLDVIA